MADVWEALGGVKVIEIDSVVKPVRAFLIPQAGKYLLVDTGYADTVDQLIPIIEKHRISNIILTHLHTDHSGGAPILKAMKNTAILYHEDEFKSLKYALHASEWLPRIFEEADVENFEKALDFLRRLPEPDAFVSDKSVIDGWKIMHTPGHTPGHVALTNGIVAITGDLILADDTSNVAYVPLKGYRPLSSYLRSIVATANLKVDLFLPSHGDVFRDVRQRVSEIFDHHYERLSQAAKALGKGLSSAREVAQQIKWSSGIFQKLSPLEKWLAILETISHLDFLVETGYAVTTSVLNYGVSETADWNAVKSKLTLIADNLWSK